MNKMNILQAEFVKVLQKFQASPAIQRLHKGELTIEHYKSYLRQTYHYSKNSPQIKTLATTYFRGSDRKFVRMFYKHATSEIGHDELALNDLKTLGEDVDHIRIENPLPTTVALNAFAIYQICNRNPIGYLGYSFFLEFLPTSSGTSYMELLEKVGIPREAMSFITEHANVDVYHNKMMEKYVDGLIVSESDLQSVIYTLRGTGELFAHMLESAFKEAESSEDWGIDSIESARYQHKGAGIQEVASDDA